MSEPKSKIGESFAYLPWNLETAESYLFEYFDGMKLVVNVVNPAEGPV